MASKGLHGCGRTAPAHRVFIGYWEVAAISDGHCEISKPIAAHASASVVSSEKPNRLARPGLGLIDGGDSEENVNMLGRLAAHLGGEIL